jgi:hypothetical protein
VYTQENACGIPTFFAARAASTGNFRFRRETFVCYLGVIGAMQGELLWQREENDDIRRGFANFSAEFAPKMYAWRLNPGVRPVRA